MSRDDILDGDSQKRFIAVRLKADPHSVGFLGLCCEGPALAGPQKRLARRARADASARAVAAISLGSQRVGLKSSTRTSPSTIVVLTFVPRLA